MMQVSQLKEKWPVILIVLGTILLVALGGRYTAFNGFSYVEIIYLLVIFVTLAVAFSGVRGFRIGLIGAIAAMGIGYRTLEVHPYIRLHPAEVAIWGLAILMLIQKITRSAFEITWWLPKWVVFMAPFWGWAWAMAFMNGNFIGDVLREFRNFIVLIPLFIILSTLLQDRTYWRTILTSFFVMGSMTALLGAVEFIFPGIASAIPGFSSLPPSFLTPEGFQRASFGFWGSPAAVFILVLSLPLMFILLKWWRKPYQMYLIYFGAFLHLIGVYIGGYRSVWFFMGLQLVIWLIIRRGVLVGLYLLIPLILVVQFAPESAQERMASLYVVFEGNVVDSSAKVRLDRINFALGAIRTHPLGGGWAYAGWVHNDLLQVAANLGLPAMIILLYGWIAVVIKLVKGFFASRGDAEQNAIYFAFTMSMAGVMLLFLSQGVLVLPQFALPVWYIWVMAEIFLHQRSITLTAPIQ
jgi:hypothetical protein